MKYANELLSNRGFKKVTFNESLAKFYPKIAKEWHPNKNGNLKPSEVTPHSFPLKNKDL